MIALAGPWDRSAAPSQPSSCLFNSEPTAYIANSDFGIIF